MILLFLITCLNDERERPMLLHCDISIAAKYTSQAQKSRVLSEKWLESNGYCLACECDVLRRTSANTRATDFVCPECEQNYELKAFRIRPTSSLVDGAYQTLMDRILERSAPTLMMLERSELWEIRSLTAVHHVFLTPGILEKRKPLSLTARRAGWTGCNIRLDRLPSDAQIEVIGSGKINDRGLVRSAFRRFERLDGIAPETRGWTTLTLRLIRELRTEVFELRDLYKKEGQLMAEYPSNRNIRAKIRQQLQVLRDLGYLDFLGAGTYRLKI
jgi:type II restriction enzyme